LHVVGWAPHPLSHVWKTLLNIVSVALTGIKNHEVDMHVVETADNVSTTPCNSVGEDVSLAETRLKLHIGL
jgi:hypothetical protein